MKAVLAYHVLSATALAGGIHLPLITTCPNFRLPGGMSAFLVKAAIRQHVSRDRRLPALAVMVSQRTTPECLAAIAPSVTTPTIGVRATPGLIRAFPTMMAEAASDTAGRAAAHVTPRPFQKRPAPNVTMAMAAMMIKTKARCRELYYASQIK
ncbi:MAG: hypothetical protein CVU44_07590 [Chloroflexi bacterium HGW-Chloroflexi-6]|nr:MAG: hypothetical protein CVU44_07590 [Chloroflexi bacterium HGW-Chloroflexi-6]